MDNKDTIASLNSKIQGQGFSHNKDTIKTMVLKEIYSFLNYNWDNPCYCKSVITNVASYDTEQLSTKLLVWRINDNEILLGKLCSLWCKGGHI